MVDVVNKQNIDFEVIENDSFDNMVEIVNMSQWKL